MKGNVNLPAVSRIGDKSLPLLTPVGQPVLAPNFLPRGGGDADFVQARAAYENEKALASQNGPQALDIYF